MRHGTSLKTRTAIGGKGWKLIIADTALVAHSQGRHQENSITQACRIVFALYPDVTQLDFTGPLEVFARLPGAECILASERGGDLLAGPGMTLTGVKRLADIPDCQLLCVPGGLGTVQAIASAAYFREIGRLANGASTIVSVCTGSLLLAAAGLLKGKRAACHWASREHLKWFGVQPDAARVVRDGNVVTGGGVTAGINMALEVVSDIAVVISLKACS